MKHITTLIALALVLGSLAPLTAQNKMTAKEKRTQTGQQFHRGSPYLSVIQHS